MTLVATDWDILPCSVRCRRPRGLGLEQVRSGGLVAWCAGMGAGTALREVK